MHEVGTACFIAAGIIVAGLLIVNIVLPIFALECGLKDTVNRISRSVKEKYSENNLMIINMEAKTRRHIVICGIVKDSQSKVEMTRQYRVGYHFNVRTGHFESYIKEFQDLPVNTIPRDAYNEFNDVLRVAESLLNGTRIEVGQ